MLEYADCQTEEAVQLAHPFSVTLCKIFVYGNDMNAVACKCVKICRKCSHEGFTFTCFHFTDTSSVKDDTAYDLHTEMLHSQHTP